VTALFHHACSILVFMAGVVEQAQKQAEREEQKKKELELVLDLSLSSLLPFACVACLSLACLSVKSV
jgi:hypothetical protein